MKKHMQSQPITHTEGPWASKPSATGRSGKLYKHGTREQLLMDLPTHGCPTGTRP